MMFFSLVDMVEAPSRDRIRPRALSMFFILKN